VGGRQETTVRPRPIARGVSTGRERVGLAILVGALAAVPLPLVAYGVFVPGCVQGGEVATLAGALVPLVVANSPIDGTAIGYHIVHNGSSTVTTGFGGAENGTVWAYFEYENWTIFREAPGLDGPVSCSSQFVAVAVDEGSGLITPVPVVTIVNFTNDSAAPTYSGSNSSGVPIVYYYSDFYNETTSISTCGEPGRTLTTQSIRENIGLGFDFQGAWHILPIELSVDTAYKYHFDGNSGTWAIDNLSEPGGPGGGWAFSYLGPCSLPG
jgi:hypothetical protein